jgi:signal transduction histidine kinase
VINEKSEGRVDLANTLDELRERLAPTARATRAVFEIECPRGLSVVGDAHAVRSAVENVAANALEALLARGMGGKLALRAQRHDGTVDLFVQDDGPGIAPEVRDRLFTPFASGHNGTGLGLAIARALARAGGGELICARSEPGRTTFRFTFRSA